MGSYEQHGKHFLVVSPHEEKKQTEDAPLILFVGRVKIRAGRDPRLEHHSHMVRLAAGFDAIGPHGHSVDHL